MVLGVKDDPDNVRQAASAIEGLRSAFGQLLECRTLDRSGNQALKDRLLKCGHDLNPFDEKLKGLTIRDLEKRRGRCWKRLKCVYKEKGLDKVRTIVTGHTAVLNLYVAIIQRCRRNIGHPVTTTSTAADVRNHNPDDGVFSSITVFDVNRVLPARYPIFSIVRERRFDDFIALFRDGKASLRDHDEYGASLLRVGHDYAVASWSDVPAYLYALPSQPSFTPQKGLTLSSCSPG